MRRHLPHVIPALPSQLPHVIPTLPSGGSPSACNSYRRVDGGLRNDAFIHEQKIPKNFTEEHREKILLNDVTLIVSDDKAWPFGLMVSCDGNIWLQKGWPEFAQHYRLKIGHLLLFKHLGKSVFHVRIFKERFSAPIKSHKPAKENDPSFQETKGKSKTDLSSENRDKHRPTNYKALEAAKAFMADNPNSYILEITASYTRTSGLMSNGRKWGPIKCKAYNKYNYGRMYGDNLKKFRDENRLVVGDACVFELINEVEHVLKVTIFRVR
ncbi:DNA-binding pseudobarrel domain-containing protein [Artemisia annua]|uniref:DNA-binding pseudobarrel domain-containing protein n=1 Tax=Artemisia annua TaxID=35608 RepID=A0A2U1MTF5_ARTAN|nr:DNA-binding pseudobarrel domain-containing protein [Artemisia annua]